ncbi:hypothetical protein J2X83_003281 [Brevibacillus nitrificans]|nr:hypothetical protein [Brevibacillus nitrificans]
MNREVTLAKINLPIEFLQLYDKEMRLAKNRTEDGG